MKIFKKISILCLAVLLVCSTAFFAVGCGRKDWEHIQLNEVTHSIFYAPLYVAINQGYFEDEGVSVTLTNGGGSDVSMNSLLSNSSDIILAGPETVVYTNRGDDNSPVVFGQLTACDGSFIVSKEQNEDFTLQDLVGETIIGGRAGGMPAMTLEYIIKEAGLEIGTGAGKVNLRTDVAFNLTGSVWANTADVKYCTLFEPTATTTARANNGYVVKSVGELSGSIPYTCFAAKKSYLKEHGDIAEKFLSAVAKGYKFLTTGSADAVAAALLPSFEGSTLEEMKIAVAQYKSISAWDSDMIMTEESFNNMLDVLEGAGVISERADFYKLIDNSIAAKVVGKNAV